MTRKRLAIPTVGEIIDGAGPVPEAFVPKGVNYPAAFEPAFERAIEVMGPPLHGGQLIWDRLCRDEQLHQQLLGPLREALAAALGSLAREQ